ncbi:hypothetical protein B7494_g5714 [Chlorociboria aeruginascens]|nr:hypothetical protein B7494_g5714 [Chlorociboria aeruginascens]
MEEQRKGKAIKSAFDSTTFDAEVSIHVERKVGSATISPSGRDVALASTDGLDIIDLDSPLNPPRHLRHGLPWLVADVQWSPFAVRDYWVVSTANQKALVWNLNMQEDASQGAIEHTLHGHSRAITDINFSAHHPDMLATQPVLTFCDWFAGATQVKYNRQDSHILASSHDRWLRIWDDRMGPSPLRSINAHESKIYGVDWNRTRSTGIVTCSLDKSIKFWDYGNDLDEPERIIRTDFPVWRARHTPFGWGLLASPQDAPGNLHLYERRLKGKSKDCTAETVMTFTGHGNHKVKEFLWRSRGSNTDDGVDSREFQLVSWGEDNQLRLQHVDGKVLEGVGYVKGTQMHKKLNLTRKGAVYKTFRTMDNPSGDKKSNAITSPRPGSAGIKVSALSPGVRKAPLPSTRTHMMVRAPAMKGKDKSLKPDDQNQKQIGWMSGIKITKQENYLMTAKRQSSRRLSLLNPEFEDDENWDSPENLHDEIIRIHEQLPKIKFEDVNMDKRTIVISMNGPWGENENAIYIKATIIFPDQYPETKSPTFTLGKTSLMSNDTYIKLKREVHQIAAGFVSRRQGCLEATLCYLLGEVDLEASTTLFKDVNDLDDDLDGLADESSSDDEDGIIPAGASAMMSQELESGATDMLTNASRNANVPLPRLCGARFSMAGKLVCFFPPKEDKIKSLLSKMVAQHNSHSKEPAFETFGRLSNCSPVPRSKTLSLAEESRAGSDESEDSDLSSSSDSDSSHYQSMPFPVSEYWRRSNRRAYVRASPTILSQKSSAAGTGTGTAGSRGRLSKPKNIIFIHDICDTLPSKKQLADNYAIFGNGPEVCEHNASVAERHGYQDHADVWRYASMLLHNEVPLEILEQTHCREPILVVARDVMRTYRRNSGSDSGVDVSFDRRGRRCSLSGRVKWGTSPLSKQFISDLFSYYEGLADVQMLAMLSCIFSEPAVKDAASQVEIQMGQPQTPLSMKTPAFSLDYFPSDAAAWSMYQKTQMHSAVSTPKLAQTPSGLYGSMGSSNGIWGSDPASASYSCGDTPPLISNRGSSEHLNQQAQSLSTSPENPRNLRRANSGLASSFAASFSRPFATASSSPPNLPIVRKRPSPVENMLNTAITWGNTTVLGSVKEQNILNRPSYSDNENAKDEGKLTICTGISLAMENQNAFDDEGCMTTSLLDPGRASLYEGYRRAYAELLFVWGHPLARLEILKFNNLEECYPKIDITGKQPFAASIISNDTILDTSALSPIILGKKDLLHGSSPTVLERGLDVTGYCLKHESRLGPLASDSGGGAVGHCDRCKSIQRQLRCTVCMEPVSALFPPCLSCGCVAHQHCLLEYHSFGDTHCPGGCDCNCGQKASLGIVESWEVMMGAIEQMRLIDKLHGIVEKNDGDTDDQGGWENIAVPSGGLGRGYSTLSKRLEQGSNDQTVACALRHIGWEFSNGSKLSLLEQLAKYESTLDADQVEELSHLITRNENVGEAGILIMIEGTGLQQSLLALALSRSDKKILHIDQNEYYGDSEAAFSLQEVAAWVEKVGGGSPTIPFRNASLWKSDDENATGTERLSFSRAYNLTLSPQIIYTKSKLLAQLVSSKIYRQLEFQAVGNWWIYEPQPPSDPITRATATLKRLPNGREDIFHDSSVDNRAKRSLMKFLKFVVDYENRTEVWESHASSSLPDFLSSQYQIPPNLQTVILALTLSLDSPEETQVGYSLPRIARHLTSIGILGPGFGAVVPKWGGAAEIAQVACRAGAVGGGVYVLGVGINTISTINSGPEHFEEVDLSNGEKVKTQHLIRRIDLDDRTLEQPKTASKIIAIVSSPLSSLFASTVEGSPTPAVSVVVFPANVLQVDGQPQIYPVYIMTHSSDTGECPSGQCVLYITTRYTSASKILLNAALESFLQTAENGNAKLLYTFYYEQIQGLRGSSKNQGVLDESLDLAFNDTVLEDVEDIWSGIVVGSDDKFMQFGERNEMGNDDDDYADDY